MAEKADNRLRKFFSLAMGMFLLNAFGGMAAFGSNPALATAGGFASKPLFNPNTLMGPQVGLNGNTQFLDIGTARIGAVGEVAAKTGYVLGGIGAAKLATEMAFDK